LEELVRKVVDLMENRVESNLRAIANTLLVDLPSDRSFTYDDFIASQNKFQVGAGPGSQSNEAYDK
jgi:dynein heavy chain